MRTDVKIGLVFLFLIALGVVSYYAFLRHPASSTTGTSEISTPEPGLTPANGATGADATGSVSVAGPAASEPAGGAVLQTNELQSAASQPATSMPALGGPSVAGAGNGTGGPVLAGPALAQGSGANGAAGGGLPTLSPASAPAVTTQPSPFVNPNVESPAMPTVNGSAGGSASVSTGSHRLGAGEPSMPELTPMGGSGETSSAGGSSLGNVAGSTYVVKKGDLLAKIAKSHHVTVKAIEGANPGLDANHIKVGQKIKLPEGTSGSLADAGTTGGSTVSVDTGTSGSSGSTGSTTHSAKNGHHHAAAGGSGATATAKGGAHPGGTYTVKKGDSLTKIAEEVYGSKKAWRKIAKANADQLDTDYTIEPGMVLKLPAK